MNRGPQLGFHNDISGGQTEPSAVQMGKLRRRLLQSLGREEFPISYSGPSIFSTNVAMSWSARWQSLSAQTETGMEGSWITWPHGPPLLLTHQRGTLPHLSCWEGALGSGA